MGRRHPYFLAVAVGGPPDAATALATDTWVMAPAASTHLFEELVPPLSDAEALLEADRCLECGGPHAEAPCTVACPADVDVSAFVAAVARGEPGQAAATIFSENLLGGTCARVCPVEILCEGACVLLHEGRRPVEIGRLQRYAVDHAFAMGFSIPTAPPGSFRVAVIGAGPAGLACAGELASLGHRATVYDERDEPGGLVRFGIAPYRQQREPLPDEAQLLESLGVELRLAHAIDSAEALGRVELEADAIVLAVGLGKDVDADFPGSALAGVWDSLPFIERLKTSTPPEIGERALVIGGGNTAIDVAREALRLGAARVTLCYRRTRAEMPAYPHEVEEASQEGVELLFLTQPVRFLGEERVDAVECRRMRLGAPGADDRPHPEPVPGSEFLVRADTVVKAIGQSPRRELLSWIEGLELEGGVVPVDPATGRTANPRYFAAGDVTNGGATVVEAVRQAKVVARAIDALAREEAR